MILHDEEYLPQALALITSAKNTIDIATFKAEIPTKTTHFRLKILYGLLCEKRDAGVKIRFLININEKKRGTPRSNIPAIQYLKAHKIDTKTLRENRCMHAKIIMADQDRAIVGSHNLSIKSCFNNFEISYLIIDPVNIARLAALYNNTWINAQPTP
jgi:phosphatidylserine/phosphatidylglycerophosphate/cardiolipin synthase-like enzyme